MGPTSGRLAALYGGRHLRTTLALAATSIVAGVATGFVGVGVAGTRVAHDTPAPARHAKPVKHHHPATEVPVTVVTDASPRHSQSASPTPTRTRSAKATPTATATPKPSTTPTATATTAPPSSPASQPASDSPPG